MICLIGFISPVFGGEIESALDDAPRVTLTTTGIHGDPYHTDGKLSLGVLEGR
jgi:hypothetical protein